MLRYRFFLHHPNQLLSTTELWLNREGDALGEVHYQMIGQYNSDARWKYKQFARHQWKDTFTAELSRQFPNIHVDSVHISALDVPDIPLEIKVKFHVKKYVKRLNKQVLLPLPIDEFSDYAENCGTGRTYLSVGA